MANNTVKFQKTWEISGSLDLINGESATQWTGSTDASNVTTSTTHLTGSTSLSFDKSGTTVVTGSVTSTLDNKNGNLFALEKIKLLINLSSLTNVSSVVLTLGSSSTNNNTYSVADTALSTGWNEVDFDCDSPAAVNGTGVDWYNLAYIGVSVVFDAAGNTLTAILVDTISLFSSKTVIGTGAGGAIEVIEQEMPVAEDNTNGVYATVEKPLANATYKGTSGTNNSFTTTNLKATAGTLIYAAVTNTTASVRYFQIHNTATTPAGGATAIRKYQIPVNSQVILTRHDLGVDGAYCSTGIAIANSTAAGTYTAGTATDLLVDYNFI